MFFLLCLISTFVFYFSKHFQIAVYIDKYGSWKNQDSKRCNPRLCKSIDNPIITDNSKYQWNLEY